MSLAQVSMDEGGETVTQEDTAREPTGDVAAAVPAPLAALVGRIGALKERPIERWNPAFCGELAIRIDGAGRWSYMGSPIARPALVALFASILRREEDGNHYLVTPVEKVRIAVDDAAFAGVELRAEGDAPARVLGVRTNFDEWVLVGAEHPLRFALEAATDGLKAYVALRRGLEALLTRGVMHDLVALAEERPGAEGPVLGVSSGGHFYPLPEAAA